MSIVVFDPDRIDEVDFAERMRHPAAADPAGGMWLSDTEPSYIDANALRQGRLKRLRSWMAEALAIMKLLFCWRRSPRQHRPRVPETA